MTVPLEKRTVNVFNSRTNREEECPALHERWKHDVRFILYQAPPLDPEDQASLDQWTERASFIKQDLSWLLRQPHDKFWCQVIFDATLHRCIDSYLHQAPRSHDVVYSLPADIQDIHNEIHRLVYLVCVRMATYKESKKDHITPEEFGKIIYENYIFDIPKLMDLCVLYGSSCHGDQSNRPLLTKMITNIFTQQPKYEEDLCMVVPTILQVLQNIGLTCGINISASGSSPVKLDAATMPTLVAMDTTKFQDVVFYLSDTAHTLWMFLEIYPPATKNFLQDDFCIRLAQVYDALFPVLSDAMRRRQWPGATYQDMIQKKIQTSQLHFLKIFREIISQSCLMPLLENRSSDETAPLVEDYMHNMTGILGERRFLAHYEYLYPFVEDRDILLQAKYQVDETRLRFILDAVHEAVAIYGHRKIPADDGAAGQAPGDAFTGVDYEAVDSDEACAAVLRRLPAVEVDSLISSIQDLLPDLGGGFIQLCLEEVDYDTERVINMLLENSLPKSLQQLDRSLPRLPRDDSPKPEESVLSSRRNIYDDDEFDVFSRDKVDVSRIHQGKKDNFKGGAEVILNDKSVITQLRPLYDRYGHEYVESMYDTPQGGYDDEYDDTYDELMVGAADADELEQLTNQKKLFEPTKIFGRTSPNEKNPAEKEEESESEEEVVERSRDNFIEDPAKIRERQEQRRQARRGQGQPYRHAGHGQEGQGQGAQGEGEGQKTYDVKGGAKGQGQSSDVLRNRAWKEKHKSSRVHHNRRALADKKRKV